VLEPVDTTGLGPDDVPALKAKVFERIADGVERLRADEGTPGAAR